MKRATVKTIKFNGQSFETYIQEPKFVEVTRDYKNLSGELIAEKGAIGYIASEDRGMIGVAFLNNGKYTREPFETIPFLDVKNIETPEGVRF